MSNLKSTNPIIGTGLKTLSKIQDGSSTAILELTNDSHVIPCDEYGKNGNYETCKTTVNFYIGNILDVSGEIKVEVDEKISDYNWDPRERTLKVNAMDADESYVDFTRNYLGQDYKARFSISKVRNGGGAFLIDLTNDNHTFVSDTRGMITASTSTTTEVLVYKGTELWKVERISTFKVPKGMSCSVLDNNQVEITALEGKDLPPHGSFEIQATVKTEKDGEDTTILKKAFSWSKTRDGNGITIVEEYYKANNMLKGVSSPVATKDFKDGTEDWHLKVPELSVKARYLWNFERVIYNNDEVVHTNAAMIGSYSEDGNGITKIENYYLATDINKAEKLPKLEGNIGTDVPEDEGVKWTLSLQQITLERKYLWNIEKIYYTKKDPTITEPALIGVHGENGEAGPQGDPGDQGDPGIGYTIAIGSGAREITYAADGSSPEPAELGTYNLLFYNNGKEIQPQYIKWSCGGNIELFGSNNQKTFTPKLALKYKKGLESFVAVSVRETSTSVEVSHKIPISCVKHAGGLDWIEEWNGNTTEINDERIVTPKIFAGKSGEYTDALGNKFYKPTGVAIGRDMFGTGTPNIGIAGYKNNTKTFHLDTNGDLWMGNKSGYLQFNDKVGFELKVSKFNIGGMDMDNTPKSIDVYYYLSNSSSSLQGGSWTTTAPKWQKGKYIWSVTITKYFGKGVPDKIVGPMCISGVDGRSIDYIQEQYALHSSRESIPSSGISWYNTPPQLKPGFYIWTKSIIHYTDGGQDETKPICSSGENGLGLFITYNDSEEKPNNPSTADGNDRYGWHTNPTDTAVWMSQKHSKSPTSGVWSSPMKIKGATGKGIRNIVEKYAASSSYTSAPNSWSTSMPQLTETNKYLWNYEEIYYTDNSMVPTNKRVIGTYSKNGKDGRGIQSIINYYLVSNRNSGIYNYDTTSYTWQTSVQTTDVYNRYLWNYEQINYTEGPPTKTSARIIGTYGETGLQGPAGPKLPWLEAWEGNSGQLTNEHIITPKIFAGTKDSSGITGVAIGKNVFPSDSSKRNDIGITGYNKNTKTFYLNQYGNFWVGNGNNYMKFENGIFEIQSDNIKFGTGKTIKSELNGKANTSTITELQTQITANKNGLSAKVESSTFNSEIKAIRGEISQKVSSKDFDGKVGSIVEQKITPTSIVNKVASGINGGNSLITSTTILDRTGLTVKGGHFTFYDAHNDMALSHQGGGLYTQGGIQAAVAPHNKPVVRGRTLSSGTVGLHSWRIVHETFNSLPLIISTNSGVIEFRNLPDTEYTNIKGYRADMEGFATYTSGWGIGTCTLIRNELNSTGNDGHYQMWLNKRTTSPSDTVAVIGNGAGDWGHLIAGSLHVKGNKNCVQDTKNYGCRAINAYETAEYYFGDIGEGIIGEDGLCYITIEDIFSEVVNTKHIYQVFLQKYGNGDVWIKDRKENYFIVEGTPNTSFAWEIKAKRRGYESNRMELVGGSIIKMTDEPIYEL